MWTITANKMLSKILNIMIRRSSIRLRNRKIYPTTMNWISTVDDRHICSTTDSSQTHNGCTHIQTQPYNLHQLPMIYHIQPTEDAMLKIDNPVGKQFPETKTNHGMKKQLGLGCLGRIRFCFTRKSYVMFQIRDRKERYESLLKSENCMGFIHKKVSVFQHCHGIDMHRVRKFILLHSMWVSWKTSLSVSKIPFIYNDPGSRHCA